MAVADIMLIVEYIPFLMKEDFMKYLDAIPEKNFSWGWAVYYLFHSNFSVVIHNIVIWLTLTVAVWRFIMIKYLTYVPVLCTMDRCHWVLFSAYGKVLHLWPGRPAGGVIPTWQDGFSILMG